MGRGHESTLREGQIAPDAELQTVGGGVVRVSQLAARGPVLLAFYKDTCPTCQLTMPFLNRARGSKIAIYGVSQDNLERTKAFARDFGIKYELLIDPADAYAASNEFGITTVPSMFVISPERKVLWASFGFMKVDIESLAELTGVEILTAADDVPAAKPG
jgi:peroxiredoxin